MQCGEDSSIAKQRASRLLDLVSSVPISRSGVCDCLAPAALTIAFAPACVHQRCCKDGGTQCDQSQTQCMTGDTCLETFFGR